MFYASAAVCFVMFAYFLNLAIFVAWQTSFTNADIAKLESYFYFDCAIMAASLFTGIFLFLKGRKIGQKNKKMLQDLGRLK